MEETEQNMNQEISNYTFEQLIELLKQINISDDILGHSNQVNLINNQFTKMYQTLLKDKKDKFFELNPDAVSSDFEMVFPLKQEFDELFDSYRSKKKKIFTNRKTQEENNLKIKQQLLLDLKQLIDEATDFSSIVKQVLAIKDKWTETGSIPVNSRDILWNDYKFHLERFFDQLHLGNEIREKEFTTNLEIKKDIIRQANELLNEENTLDAFVKLQNLHKIWKDETGPVSQQYRSQIWNEFTEVTIKIHEKRDAYRESLKKEESENYTNKEKVLDQIKGVNQLNFVTHKDWQNAIKTIDKLRAIFESLGRVPKEQKEGQWAEFKKEIKTFNHNKNSFYKNQKIRQQEILDERLKMIETAELLKESEDFESTTPQLKELQLQWKNAKPIPRKHADELWGKFKEACNFYFDRYRLYIDKKEAGLMGNYETKQELLTQLKSFEFTGEPQKDVAAIKGYISLWKQSGKVPMSKRRIEGDFHKQLDKLFDQVNVSRKETQMIVFNEKLEKMIEENDINNINKEIVFIRKKIADTQQELLQLKNNIQFFANVDKNNPMFKDVNKSIRKVEDDHIIWKEKLSILNKAIKK